MRSAWLRRGTQKARPCRPRGNTSAWCAGHRTVWSKNAYANKRSCQPQHGAFMPVKAHADDAGWDLRTPKQVYLMPDNSVVIDTGVHMNIPKGYVGMLKSKSGLNVNYGITCEGTIDSGYTGSIKAKLFNHSNDPYMFEAGDKITQIVFIPIPDVQLVKVDALNADTERGDNGFGSSGR